MALDKKYLDRVLSIEIARVTEAAAIASARYVGRGDNRAADQAAVDAMRRALNMLDIEGVVVIGEGERDEAPMLYIGEEVGTKNGPHTDIALDPLEGTSLCAKAMPNSIAVIAMAEGGTLLHAPDVYMEKIAIGGGYPEGVVDLDADPGDNVRELAKAKGVKPEDINVCVLERPRHDDLIEKLRSAGAGVRMIQDGDVAGIIHTTEPEKTRIDMYLGVGGAPEGVLAAAALRCIGGQMQSRLVFRNDDEKARAAKWGITDLDKRYDMQDMASGDVMFAATGVTDGTMLDGISIENGFIMTHSVVMRSKTGTTRWIHAKHRAEHKLNVVGIDET
jgi:fructose-1,6-bisphosphatase II / sedoheptulose-1,7-bisphosphatase